MPRLAVAQPRPATGDSGANLQKIGGVLAQIAKLDPPVDLVVFPETATSGYFVEGGVRDVAVTAGTLFRDLTVEHEAAGAPPVDVAIGFYEVFQNHFYNSCLYASLGGKDAGVQHVHRKVFLPTYGVFDEERFVARGREIRAFDTRWGRAAILVCEDAWHSLSGTIAALQGAQLVIVPSASPARGTGMDEEGTRLPASVVRWERILKGIPHLGSRIPRARGGERGGGRRSPRDRCRLGSAMAGQLLKGRSRPAPRVHQGDRRALGRRGLVAHGVPRGRGAR